MMLRPILLAVCVFLPMGCETYQPFRWPKSPGVINHVVFFDLKDPSDSDQLIMDCNVLESLPEVSAMYAGQHYEMGRSSVLQNYDVGFFVAFNSEADYLAYIEHPKHKQLVEKWKPRWDSIRIYDIGNAQHLWDPWER